MEPMTKDRLLKYQGIRLRVNNRKERLARLKSNERFPAAKESDGSKHQVTGFDRQAAAVMKRMAYEDEIREVMAADEAELNAIKRAVNSLEDPIESEVLWLRYIEGEIDEDGIETARPKKWKDIAIAMGRKDDDSTIRSLQNVHSAAIDHIAQWKG